MTTKHGANSSTAEPTRSEHCISRSKQTIQASRELISNSRIMQLTSVARFTRSSRARAAAARGAASFHGK
jgi:hypothetical protein